MFKQEDFMGRRVLTSSLLEGEDVTAFFTTRDLPLKSGEREDLIEEVEQNKKLVCKGLKINEKNLFIPQQTHSDNVKIIDGSQLIENTDALITDQPNAAIALNFADCVPIIFYDPTKKVAACAHAGWRGTVAKIGVKTVEKMMGEFDCKPKDIIALIGPAIGKCCFEAGEEVLEKLKKSIDNVYSDFVSNTHADLKQVNKLQLLAMGLEKINVCEYCTSCQNELFFSYRKEKGYTARHSAVIKIEEKL